MIEIAFSTSLKELLKSDSKGKKALKPTNFQES